MRIVFAVSLQVWGALISPVEAQTGAPSAGADWQLAAVIECRDIIAVVQRLGCYDAAVGGTGGLGERYRVRPVTALPEAAAPPVWRLERDRDPFNETDRASVRLDRSAGGGEPANDGLQVLRVECDGSGDPLLTIGGADYLGMPGQAVPLRFRFGSGRITQEVWHVLPKGTAVAMPREGSRFLEGLSAGGAALVEVVSYRGQKLWARFPVPADGHAALDHVLGGCPGGRLEAASAAEGAGGL